jgi:Dolichyl-phosphate-mannose-protein mannosyltransferase
VRRPLALGLTVTLAVRLAIAALVRVPAAWDGYFYARYAATLAAGFGYAVSDHGGPLRPTAFYPVGYPAAMAAALTFTRDPRLAAVAVNLVASALAVTAVVFVAHRAAGPRVATVAGLAYALYPGLALWSAAAMTETLTGALLSLAMAFALSSHRRAPVGFGLALGLATLVRPQSLLLLPLVALGRGARRGALAALVALACAACVVAPWTARNCARLDACALVSTNGGSNLLIGTFPDARGGYRRPTESDGCAATRGEVGRDRCMSHEAVARIVEHPLRWAALGAAKVVVSFAWEHDPVSYALGPMRPPRALAASMIALLTLAWWALVALAVKGRRALDSVGSPRSFRFAAGAASVSVLTHAAFLGADRYHLILVPLLIPSASAAFVAWRDARRAPVA